MRSPKWLRNALKQYFEYRSPGTLVDTVDLVSYFHTVSVIDAADDLVEIGWLTIIDGVYPKYTRSQEPTNA